METDLLIVGGGPAGLGAAITADKAGANVILTDESFSLGGQLKQQTQYFNKLPQYDEKVRGTALGDNLIEQLETSNVKVLKKHTMIGSYLNENIGVTDGNKTFEIKSRKNIIAPGAAEEAKIFPGWTLPGVMTAGAAQILMNRERVLPGKNAIMLGSNDFSLEVARQLKACGVTIKAIVEEKGQIISSDSELLEDVKGVPVYVNATIESATGKSGVEQVVIQTSDELHEVKADLICIANGFSPIIEPFEILNCNFVYHHELGGWLPEYNANFQTSIPSCYIAGNAAGITSIGPILLTGEIAAIGALQELGFIEHEEAENRQKKLWEDLYELERKTNKKTFQARCELIESFYEKNGESEPAQFIMAKGELHNG